MSAGQLTFDEASHTYHFEGMPVPGVTELLKPLSNFEGIPPDVLARKCDLGRRVHAACQFFDEGDLDEDSVEEDVAPYLAGYRKFLRESGVSVLVNEQRVLDPILMFAGTLDRVFLLNGVKWLVDLKTSIAKPLSVGAQTAAYLRAMGDASVTHRAALRLKPDGTYKFDALNDPTDFQVFMACLTLFRYKETH